MLQLKDFMPVNFLKKEKYTGSCKGMRMRRNFPDGRKSAVCKNNKGRESF